MEAQKSGSRREKTHGDGKRGKYLIRFGPQKYRKVLRCLRTARQLQLGISVVLHIYVFIRIKRSFLETFFFRPCSVTVPAAIT